MFKNQKSFDEVSKRTLEALEYYAQILRGFINVNKTQDMWMIEKFHYSYLPFHLLSHGRAAVQEFLCDNLDGNLLAGPLVVAKLYFA